MADEHDSFEEIRSQDTLPLTGRAYNIENVGGEVPGGYEQMTAADIRKLCSQRGIRMAANAKKGERIARLREYDAAAPALFAAMGDRKPTQPLLLHVVLSIVSTVSSTFCFRTSLAIVRDHW